jgi:hypothetical protein
VANIEPIVSIYCQLGARGDHFDGTAELFDLIDEPFSGFLIIVVQR